MIKEARFQLYRSEYKISNEPKALRNEYKKPFESIFSLWSKKYVTTTIPTPTIPTTSTAKLFIY
jgi:hypothetical protein